jgi:hypothetical protein
VGLNRAGKFSLFWINFEYNSLSGGIHDVFWFCQKAPEGAETKK